MKTFGSFLILVAIVAAIKSASVTKDVQEQYMVIAKECQSSVGASDADLAALMNHNPSKSKEGKCMLSCIMKKVDSQDSNGKLKKEGAMNIAMTVTKNDPAEMKIAEEIIDSCVGITVSNDSCEAADEYTTCMKKAGKEKGLEYADVDNSEEM